MLKRCFGLLGVLGLSAATGVGAAVIPEPDVQVSPTGLHLVLNLPQARLFQYQDGRLSKIYPVAVGKMLTQTPTGSFDITGIYKAPAWHVPRSIQEEMRRSGKEVQTVVPPGPSNPLGPVFIRFGEAKLGLGFHGTNAPGSVPGFRSHGCVRMKNDDALLLSRTVGRGDAVTVAYQTVLLNQDAAGELWLTAYRNHYKQDDPSFPMLAETLLAWQKQRSAVVYGARVDQALKARKGVPVCLTCKDVAKAKVDGDLAVVRWLSPGKADDTQFAHEPASREPGGPLPTQVAPPASAPQHAPAVAPSSAPSSSRAAVRGQPPRNGRPA
ncbi:L,D-transpeptidase [Chromobacterium haemolyticum]|uniref:L,D-transpeptidase n=1 Tax=Chromobacterium fluminis TaxID=3044269 RepID=A0ABX0LC41_9NEIS|nr:L,D-transpeptidase [Chromobacterium haemolyticum]NHR07001.1 L,D-transpeptidase [Chromobacterium haemolyticum]